MRTLSELVKLREYLERSYSTDPITQHLLELEESLTIIGNETPLQDAGSDIHDLVSDLQTIHKKLGFNNQLKDYLIDKINGDITQESSKFLSDNYSLELKVEAEAIGNIRKVRVLELSDEIVDEIKSRIQLHTNWRYPALEIGCRDGEWTKYMVAADPLYITDHYRDFLESAVKDFTEEYQLRVRAYLARDTDLSMLPQGQMAFVFCWNFLNYRSFDTIKEYLKSVKEVLRPGGVFMFSYNNGDLHECAGYAEGFWMSYIPKSFLVPMCESLGFDVIHTRESRGEGTAISWIELRKHGELSTVKAHQVLGEIKRIGT